MSAFHQMGNDSENLVTEVTGFRGAFASPVNYAPVDVRAQVNSFQGHGFDMVLDPQLYFPRSDRGFLKDWPYFPDDFDSADLASEDWWTTLGRSVLNVAADMGFRAVCSPAPVSPSQYSNGYYRSMTNIAKRLVSENGRLRVLQTVLVRLPDLTLADRAREIASIVSDTATKHLYVVFLSDTPPRQEYAETEELKGAMLLIRELTNAEFAVTVGFAGSEVMLWMTAGAAHCATGKFMNLRRFTPGRFEDPNKGGGQAAYWFEEALLASVRESDLIRLRKQNMLSPAIQTNPHGQQILERLASEPGKAWLALGWRQYMHWFADIQGRMDQGLKAEGVIKKAEANWQQLENAKVYMEEPRNNGKWLRPWLRAVVEFEGL